MRTSRLTVLAAGLTVLAGGVAAGAAPSVASASAPARLAGQAVLVPDSGLSAVAAVSGHLAWAVGSSTIGNINSGDVTFAPLIMRWNGTAWAKVPGPVPARGATLIDVAATSAGNAWAVGSTGGTPGLPNRPFIEHWDGTSWKQVPSPQPGGDSILVGLDAASARSAWAVGTIGQRNGTCPCRALIEHWDGTSWKQVARTHQAGIDLSAVTAVSARSAWVVGDLRDKHGNVKRVVTEHWNGTAWKRVPVPDAKRVDLSGVAAVSARSVWAVGSVRQFNGSECQCRAVIEHWNGSAWKRVPSVAPAGSILADVSPVPGGAVWAIGRRNSKPLIERWNGAAWKQVPSAASPRSQTLSGVAASSSRDAWAVGGSNTGGNGGSGLILHWNGTRWS